MLDIAEERSYVMNVMMINEVLHSLKIRGTCVAIRDNRHYRIYDVVLDGGQRLKKLESQIREIGLALKSHTVPILEVKNNEGIVSIHTTISDPKPLSLFYLQEKHKDSTPKDALLPLLLGEGSDGKPVWIDLSITPHFLLAGATGSGKSVLLHTIISNIKDRNDVQLYIADPKSGTEMACHSEIATSVAYDYEGTLRIIRHLIWEMEDRFDLFQATGIKSIKESPFIVQKIVFVIDELADLMFQDKDKNNPDKGLFEKLLVQLAAKSRSVGIFIIAATQRPSIEVISGLIKANFPGRIACKVATSYDSRVIIDQTGAQDLIGRGDALLFGSNYDNLRFQVAI